MDTAAPQPQLTALYWHLYLGHGDQNGTVALHRVKKHRKQAFSRNRTVHSTFELNMLMTLRFIIYALWPIRLARDHSGALAK